LRELAKAVVVERRCRICAGAAVILILMLEVRCTPAQLVDQLVWNDGRRITAQLIDWRAGDNLVFDSAGETVVASLQDFAYWSTPLDLRSGCVAELADGSRVVGEVVSFDDDKLVIRSRDWTIQPIPRDKVRFILARTPLDPAARDAALDHLMHLAPGRVLLVNGDQVEARLLVTPVPDGRPRVELRAPSDNEPAMSTVSAASIEGASVASPEKDRDTLPRELADLPLADVGLIDGSLLVCRGVTSADDQLDLQLACGVILSCRRATADQTPYQAIAFVGARNEQSRWLADCQPSSYQFIPYLDGQWTYQKNASVNGGRLRWRDRVISHGLGMHSKSSLVFELDETYRSLGFELAIDRLAGPLGSADCRVLVLDETGEWREAFAAPHVTAAAPPLPGLVDIAGARAVAFVVDYGEDGDVMDRVNWLNARLIR
jgi:hypothetical protein